MGRVSLCFLLILKPPKLEAFLPFRPSLDVCGAAGPTAAGCPPAAGATVVGLGTFEALRQRRRGGAKRLVQRPWQVMFDEQVKVLLRKRHLGWINCLSL